MSKKGVSGVSEPLDKLVIDIQYKSSTASSGVDKLTTSLTSLRSATKGGVGLTAISKQKQASIPRFRLLRDLTRFLVL